MLLQNGSIHMSPEEWAKFKELTWAPWMPRTPKEFNLMCDLGIERHKIENTYLMGPAFAIAVEAIKFGPKDEVNFPEDKRRLAYVKAFGKWPTQEQLVEFERDTSTETGTTGLHAVK